jgi:hypothetical protein
MNAKSQRGVALVITLIMVAIITLLAVSFLALSRRDQASISVSQSDTISRLAAEAAETHAQAEILARIISASNMFAAYPSFIGYSNYLDSAAGVLVSTNIDIAALPGNRLTGRQIVLKLAGLQMNARVPVFIKHPAAGGGVSTEERYYLDFNRNGINDRPGWNPLNNSYYSGDPEWIGILEHPEFFHSATNRFVSRYAYLVLPVGNSLDLNYIHNYAGGASPLNPASASMQNDAFSRNQGVGGWEVNLAAFLQDLAPDYYGPSGYSYLVAPNGGPGSVATKGLAFQHALGLLKYRYNQSFNLNNLANVRGWFGKSEPTFLNDFIDSYSINPVLTAPFRNTNEWDQVNLPWVGSASPNRFVDMQELFSNLTNSTGAANFTNVLYSQGRSVGPASPPDDRYLFYRLLSQLSTGSEPELKGKINLNFTNDPSLNTSQTAFTGWAATNFFRMAGQAILQANLITNLGTTNFFLGGPPYVGLSVAKNFGVTNIEIYPNNQYTPLVHQLLQVAANLYDSACTNRVYPGDPSGVAFPTVFRPILARSGPRIFIKDWVEVGDAFNDPTVNLVMNLNPNGSPRVNFVNPDPVSLGSGGLSGGVPAYSTPYAYGIPWIIGAKKGFPNFNELAVATSIFVERKLQLLGPASGTGPPIVTNQMFLIGITNTYAVEAWNSYSNNYPSNFSPPHNLKMTIVMQSTALLTNAFGAVVWPVNHIPYTTNFAVVTNFPSWKGGAFTVPLFATVPLLAASVYTPQPAGSSTPSFTPYNSIPLFNNSLRGGNPPLRLYFVMTNSFRYSVEDTSVPGAQGRLVDFVTFTNLSTVIDIAAALAGTSPSQGGGLTGGGSIYGQYWVTNQSGASPLSPSIGVVNQMQSSLGAMPPPDNSDPNWPSEVSNFNLFLSGKAVGITAKEAPYAPTRLIVNNINYEVNDPLVHFMLSDITDPTVTNTISYPSPVSPVAPVLGTIGQMNLHYQPWGRTAAQTNIALLDPGVFNSDAWDFPTNKFPNVGWIGRVHRGTPWQTIYLKSGVAAPIDWLRWAGNLYTHPTNDWRLVDLFTTALNDNAASGLIPVNQQGLAAWSAVLSGVIALTNTPAGLQPFIVQPASVSNPGNPALSPVAQIVASINATRAGLTNGLLASVGSFQSVGQILQSPALSSASPFINQAGALISYASNPITDEAYERLPRQILGLIRLGQPRFVIYSYGQSLKPAEGSYALDASLPASVFNVSTNYQITGEAAYRTVFRLEGNPTHPNVVIESYTPLAPE